jgi:hypothetical protein
MSPLRGSYAPLSNKCANHRKLKTDSGLGFQVKVLKRFSSCSFLAQQWRAVKSMHVLHHHARIAQSTIQTLNPKPSQVTKAH